MTMQDITARTATVTQPAVLFSPPWFSLCAGVGVALAMHIVLNLLGVGLGFTAIQLDPSLKADGSLISWSAFAWWAVSGIIAAYAGGYTAGVLSTPESVYSGSVLGFLTWAKTTILVMVFVALTAGGTASILSFLGGPNAAVWARWNALTNTTMTTNVALTTNPAAMTPEARAEMETIRKAIASAALASVLALGIGATAATYGGHAGWAVRFRRYPRYTVIV